MFSEQCKCVFYLPLSETHEVLSYNVKLKSLFTEKPLRQCPVSVCRADCGPPQESQVPCGVQISSCPCSRICVPMKMPIALSVLAFLNNQLYF